MDASDVIRRRLHHQQLVGSISESPDEVVAWFGAMQGQDYAGAKWAVGLRCPGATLADVDQAVEEGKVVRTWLLRGTLHITTSSDIRWMLDLIRGRLIFASAARHRQLGLDETTHTRSQNVLVKALQRDRLVTRQEIKNLLERAGIPAGSSHVYHMLHRAALEGLICFGPSEGKQDTFALLDEWVPQGQEKTREDALRELARRYVRSHGPATARDFAWWSGLTLTEARAALALCSSWLRQEMIDGERTWLSEDEPGGTLPSPAVHMLPPFDEYYVGYKARDLLLESQHSHRTKKVAAGGVFRPIVLLDGQIVGIWKWTQGAAGDVITPELFRALSNAEHEALAMAVQRYSSFLALPVQLA
jgi:hypothetical protein